MGSTLKLKKGEPCILEIGLDNHPSGNLFVIRNGFIHEVRYLAENPGRDLLRCALEARDLPAGVSHFRLEFHEDLEKARYHGMAFRDHRSLRLLSNPIYVEVAP
jgi:hypothetical protein